MERSIPVAAVQCFKDWLALLCTEPPVLKDTHSLPFSENTFVVQKHKRGTETGWLDWAGHTDCEMAQTCKQLVHSDSAQDGIFQSLVFLLRITAVYTLTSAKVEKERWPKRISTFELKSTTSELKLSIIIWDLLSISWDIGDSI